MRNYLLYLINQESRGGSIKEKSILKSLETLPLQYPVAGLSRFFPINAKILRKIILLIFVQLATGLQSVYKQLCFSSELHSVPGFCSYFMVIMLQYFLTLKWWLSVIQLHSVAGPELSGSDSSLKFSQNFKKNKVTT